MVLDTQWRWNKEGGLGKSYILTSSGNLVTGVGVGRESPFSFVFDHGNVNLA